MNKRGSHVGMVLSFVIFVTFLLFIFSVLQPEIQEDKTNKAAMKNLEREIIENISNKLSSFTLSVKNESIKTNDCFKINNLIPEKDKVIIRNSSKEIIGASNSGGNLVSEYLTKRGFFKVYHSHLFEEEKISCKQILVFESNYSVSSKTKTKYIFSLLAKELANSLEIKYNSMKNILNVPKNKDFQFALVLNNGTEIGNLNISENLKTNVEFKEWPVQYVDDKANILPGNVKIRVW